jgi:hypothetical protein
MAGARTTRTSDFALFTFRGMSAYARKAATPIDPRSQCKNDRPTPITPTIITANALLQRWLVPGRVNSSKADADDATLIDPVELATA